MEKGNRGDLLQDGKHAVNSAMVPVDGPTSDEVVVDKVVLNHYVTKSLEHYVAKMKRGSGMGNKKTIEFFDDVQLQSTAECTYALTGGGQ